MRTVLLLVLSVCCLADFIRFPFPGLPSGDLDSRADYAQFRKKQQIYLLVNMLRVDPQAFVRKYMKPLFADDSWKLLFKTEAVRLKKFPDYYPLYQDALLEQTAAHARLGESFAATRSRLKDKLPAKLDGFVPGYKPLKLLAQTLVWKAKSANDFFSYLCHGHYMDVDDCSRKNLVLSGCRGDYIDRKTPRGRIRFLLRQTGVLGCNTVDTTVKNDNLFACDVTYPDFSPRLRVKSPLVAGNWFYSGVGTSRIYAVVIHVPQKERVNKVELVIDGTTVAMNLAYENGVSQVYSITYEPQEHVPSNMKGYFFHAVINGRNFFYPAQYYYDWQGKINLEAKQRYDGNCKTPFPDRTCDVCEPGYRNNNGTCAKCAADFCDECTEDSCTKCAKGHYMSYGSCSGVCVENCDVCSDAYTCDKCAPTHFMNVTNGTCDPCGDKFDDCATCTADKCLTYVCQHQDPTCINKYTPGLFYSNVTEKCEKCSEGCKHCEPDHAKGSVCKLCNDGLFLTEEGECIPCFYVEGCKAGQCDGYKCLKCKRGYYQKGKGCARCEEACSVCTDNGTCIDCIAGYHLDEEFGKCIQHFDPEHCDLKDNNGLCIKCAAGYGFDKYRKCAACDPSCKECSANADKCTSCKDTFFLEDGKCAPCSKKGCDMCDEKQCFSCLQNSYLHNGVCIRGPAGCSLCHNSAPVCRVCEKGMKMDNGHCVPDCDVKNCAKCNGDETCRYCKSTLNPFGGYEPAPNASEPCPFVCDPTALNCVVTEKMKRGEVDVCFSIGCKYCPAHTFRKNYKCVECGTGCANCLNEKECVKCLPGYVYYRGECMKTQCNGTCGEGEYLENCTCNYCKDRFRHCAACNGKQCIECAPRFYVAENGTSCLPCTKGHCPRPHHCHGKDCLPPVDPDCPPCTGPDCVKPVDPVDPVNPDPIPVIPDPVVPECQANFSRIGDSMLFDPMCTEHDSECYCKKCMCGYTFSVNHTCAEVSEDQKVNLCCEQEDGCCVQCPAGYKLENCTCTATCKCGLPDSEGNCKNPAVLDNCKETTCDGECKECMDGYHLANKTACIKCIDNCTACTTATTCDTCADGFHLNATTGLCDKCIEGCSGTCDTTGLVCDSCAVGEYLNETTGLCESCQNCLSCLVNEDTVYCTSCVDGSVPLNGVCSKSTTFTRAGADGVVVLLVCVMLALLF